MGKYKVLGEHLMKLSIDEVIYTFSDIEMILGFPLPNSARKYHPWWANDRTHVHAADGWLNVGWKVCQFDMKSRRVKFCNETDNRERMKIVDKDDSKRNSETNKGLSPSEFETLTRGIMSDHFQVDLRPRKRNDWPKLFDYVSTDFQIVGDAKYYSMVRGVSIPPAKFSTISEHVWMLEKLDTTIKFLVFGNDVRVPQEWMKRYGEYVKDVEFYFINNDNILKRLYFSKKDTSSEINMKSERVNSEMTSNKKQDTKESKIESMLNLIKTDVVREKTRISITRDKPLADQIREFIGITYIDKTRKKGGRKITIRSGDVHSEMGLSNRMPAVCGALDTRKFKELYNLKLIERRGPHQGANVYFTFELLL